MLSSKLTRPTCISRSFVPHPTIPTTLAAAPFVAPSASKLTSFRATPCNTPPSHSAQRRAFTRPTALVLRQDNPQHPTNQPPALPDEPRLSLTFTCAVQGCGHRSSHEFTKRSYERGIVLVQCPECKNRHLIADHLSWFTETADEPKTIEEIVAAKGGRVRRGMRYEDNEGYETIEIVSDNQSTSTSDPEQSTKGGERSG